MTLTDSAVVVVKRGDSAVTDMIEKGLIANKNATAEDIKNMERDFTMMKASRDKDIKRKIRKARRKYGRKPKPTPKPLLYLQIGYAMVVCAFDYLWEGIKGTIDSRRKQHA